MNKPNTALLLAALLMSACAHRPGAPPAPAARTVPTSPSPATPAPQGSPPSAVSAATSPNEPDAAAPQAAAPVAPRVKTAPSAPRTAAHGQTPSVPAAQPPAAPALDFRALEQRLRDTHAIGVFTKLSLKNQVDDLLEMLRDYHHGQSKISLQDARQNYDQLLVKVLSLLQSGDPALASDIRGSREAIWGLLADPQQFQKLN